MAALKAILLVTCPQRKGLVARIGAFVVQFNGNILRADHHTDSQAGLFLSRVEWEMDGFALARDEVAAEVEKMAAEIDAGWKLIFSDDTPRVAVFVTKQDHCLLDLLWRVQSGELRCSIPLVIGSRPELEALPPRFGAAFVCLPHEDAMPEDVEAAQLNLLREYGIELVVLAKYMRLLSPTFLRNAPPVINIHHSFLPAFRGARPYHQAHARGVKVIGATAHYVTEVLDDGPIIEQQVASVSHRDNIEDLVRRGRDLERLALSQAVRLHIEGKVLVYLNRTAVIE